VIDFSQIQNEIATVVGPDHIETDPDVTTAYSVDHVRPKVVIFPSEALQIARVTEYANRNNLAIIPWGSGSKVAMGNPPERFDLAIGTSRLNQVVDIDAANLTVTVQAGVTFNEIQSRLTSKEYCCYLPMDPPYCESATIGGILAMNSTGPRRLLYGLPRDIVLGVRFVAPNGEIVGAGGKTVKNVSGYDISKLMIGSAGTLGILCETTLRLLPLPERMETLLLSYESLAAAAAFVDRVFESSLLPAAVEVLNGSTVSNMGMDGAIRISAGDQVVALALEGVVEAVTRMGIEMKEMARKTGSKFEALLREEKHTMFWSAISNLEPSMVERFPGLITLRLSFPISERVHVMDFIRETMAASNLEHAIMTHAGSGVSIVNVLIGQEDNVLTGKAIKAIEKLFAHGRNAGIRMVVQRAPTPVKADLPTWGETGSDLPMMKRIKQQLDPSGIMSPGRFVGGL
jgi:glycolate oxidase FAD binding subunit